jgi:transposase
MARRNGAVHVVTTERRYKGKVYRTHLLRRSFRENGKVKNETLGNLSHLPAHLIEIIRRSLRGEQFVEVSDAFVVDTSRHHGHVEAVLRAIRRLGFEQLLASRPCRERSLVVAMVVARILEPESKLATTRSWHTTTLPQVLDLAAADENDLYDAMDWLLGRQARIEKHLAARHLKAGGLMLYDLSSSYFEGQSCPLAAFGHNRDGKKGKLQVNYGLLTDARGCPVTVSIFKGHTSDGQTLLPQVQKLRDDFGIQQLVLVGDRGMISQKLIDEHLRKLEGVDWLTALKGETIRKLVQQKHLQLGLFDEQRLFEFTCQDYPGERFVACRNPELAKLRAHKRRSLLEATSRALEKVRATVERAQRQQEKAQAKTRTKAQAKTVSSRADKVLGKDNIGLRTGKVLNQHKVGKHFVLDIRDDGFGFHIDEAKVAAEASLDGVYVVRTSVSSQRLGTDDTVRSYKSLCQVERAFRSLKTVDLKVRPIHHHLETRVRAHIFLCMLAYYVEWHLREAWRPLLFDDQDQAAKKMRDPVAPAQRSAAAERKALSKHLDDGTKAHSFQTLLKSLSTIVRNECRVPGAPDAERTFHVVTTPNPQQQRAYELLETITVQT